MPAAPIHIVTSLHDLSGAATHCATLRTALQNRGCQVSLWSDRASPMAAYYGGRVIQPFSGVLPRGGTLVLVGAYLQLSPWIERVRPQRLILICINSDPVSLHAALARLRHPLLPPVELVYVSSRLRDTMCLDGRICPEIVDLERFQPVVGTPDRPFTLGRLSRDTPEKHHPNDASLYRMLAWQGAHVRVMGGTCMEAVLGNTPGITLLPAGAIDAPDFLRTLDVFFYRTRADWNEPSGRVVMESLACGLPVVAHVSGGYTDWLRHEENGFLFKHQEEALMYLQALRSNHSLRERMGRNARATAEHLASASSGQAGEYLAWLAEDP
jgi:glycosyltransferase involved in cell wall biosynthesis